MLKSGMHDVLPQWLQLVEQALLKVGQLPVLEEHFPFPWEAAGEALQKSLGLPQFTLSSSRTGWKRAAEFLYGMGDLPTIVALEMAPIEGSLFFILPQNDVIELTTHTLMEGDEKEGFSGAHPGVKLRQGFYHFLLLKAMQAIDHLHLFKDVAFHLLPPAPLPHEEGFCIDIACALQTRTLQARVVCPQSFLTAFKAHQPFQKTTLLSFGETSPMELSLRCEVGHTSLNREEWEALQVGDFLILDRCSFDPTEEKGSLTISLEKVPLLMARFKPEGLKVLDFALYGEEAPAEMQDTLQLTAEIGMLKMTLHQLLQLKAGSLLELSMRPEQGVRLMLESTSVAKGELLKLGEVCGISIF